MRSLAIMYHDVTPPGHPDASGFASPDANLYKLDTPQFKAHLDAIAQAIPPGVEPAVADRFTAWDRRTPLFLTFDDGGVSFDDPIAGLLEQHGWRGHFFITTGRIGSKGFLTAAQLRGLRARGHVIGSHSVNHPLRMAALTRPELEREWRDSVRALEDILGEAVPVASVPGGLYSLAAGETAQEAGIRVLFNSEPTSRPAWVRDCRLLGRYYVQRHMTAEVAAQFARGSGAMLWKQSLLWKAKKLAKAVGGSAYLALRARLLARGQR